MAGIGTVPVDEEVPALSCDIKKVIGRVTEMAMHPNTATAIAQARRMARPPRRW